MSAALFVGSCPLGVGGAGPAGWTPVLPLSVPPLPAVAADAGGTAGAGDGDDADVDDVAAAGATGAAVGGGGPPPVALAALTLPLHDEVVPAGLGVPTEGGEGAAGGGVAALAAAACAPLRLIAAAICSRTARRLADAAVHIAASADPPRLATMVLPCCTTVSQHSLGFFPACGSTPADLQWSSRRSASMASRAVLAAARADLASASFSWSFSSSSTKPWTSSSAA